MASPINGNYKKVKITLRRSLIGELRRAKACVRGLGLRRVGQQVEVRQTPENLGMIRKAIHLLDIDYPPWKPKYLFAFESDMEHAVVPIVGVDSVGDIELVASAFFIHPGGMLATAKHNLQENPNVEESKKFAGMGVLQVCSGEARVRAITHAHMHPEFDVAVIRLEPAHDGCPECTKHACVATMNLPPEKHELSALFGFPNTEIEDAEPTKFQNGEKGWIQRINYRSSFHIGVAMSHHPNGLSLTKGPCHRMQIEMDGGLSGGPAFNSNGFVVGINSSGLPNKPDSTVSAITAINEIVVADPENLKSTIVMGDLRNRSYKAGLIPKQPIAGRIQNPDYYLD